MPIGYISAVRGEANDNGRRAPITLRIMTTLDRQEILILFVSFLIGSVAGWWSRTHWGDGRIAVIATLIGTVVGYLIIVTVLRAASHPVG